jgi:acyl carrier protein
MEVLSKIQEIMAKQLSIDASTVTAEKEIVKDLGADSLDIVEMLMSFEEEFGISVPDEETVNIKTVGDVVELINKHVG